MSTEENNQDGTQAENQGGEGTESNNDRLAELEAELSKRDEMVGSLKREIKDLKKTTKTETPEKTNSSELEEKLENLSMQVAGITEDDEVKLAKDLQKETGLQMDKLLGSKYFKSELEDLRTSKANAAATSGVKGDKSGPGNVKQSADYWIAKGEYPSHEDVPDRKVRKEIRAALVAKEKGTQGGFYNS